MGRSTSRERDRDRSRRSRSRSRSRDRDSRRSRSRSRDRHDAHRDRDRERDRDRDRERERERERERGRDAERSRYGGGPAGGPSGGYPQRPYQQQQHGAARFGAHAAAAAVPASYGHQMHASAAAANGGAAAAAAKNASFLRFQQALEQHNAARDQPALVNAAALAKEAAVTRSTGSAADASAASAAASSSGAAAASSTGGKKAALETLEQLARKKLSDEAASVAQLKPVYLSKAERQAAALAKLEERRRETEAQAEKQAAHMQAFLDAARREKEEAREAAQRAARKAAEDRERKRDDDAKKRAAGPGGGNPAQSVHANNLTLEREIERGRERELELIRNHYLGVKDPSTRKVHIPASQKFKFNFDWNARDDTAVDTNALYKHRHEAAALYGRGFVGGVDRKEQRKKNNFYEELVQHRLKSGEPLGAAKLDAELLAQAVKDEPMAAAGVEEGEISGGGGMSSALAAMQARASEKALAREEREQRKAREAEKKNRHWSEKPLLEMEERDWRIFKEDFSISTRGAKVPNPLRYWREAGLPVDLMRALDQAGYKDPTPIQRAAIPIGLQCRDVIGIAETGSGKTCAFLVPMLVYIAKQPQITAATAAEGPYALIMAPTRELAQQISSECDKFSAYMRIRNVCVVGGLSIEEQAFKLREGTEIIIGTPGRLFDVIQKRYLALNVCNYIVLDEADRMIDAGFESQIQAVMDQMPSSNLRPESEEGLEAAAAADGGPDEGEHPDQGRYRQTIMFSATMPPRVEALAKKYLRHPVFISVGDREKAASRVEQRVEWLTSEGAKRGRLLELVQQSEMPLIIFTNLKKNCDSITKWLSGIGIGSVSLHGSKSQDDRMSALAAFKAGEVPVLVATDVAGRGLDVQGVKHVINYDLPDNRDGGGIEKYTHRIGRTGRAGLTGLATSFLLETDTDIMYDLANILRASNQPIPPQLAKHEAALMPPGSVSQGAPKPKGVQYSNR